MKTARTHARDAADSTENTPSGTVPVVVPLGWDRSGDGFGEPSGGRVFQVIIVRFDTRV
jgi:hypothetical protein